MTGRQLTLTAIGVSIRDELRVKSMLQLVEGKTAASWTYAEEALADLAICEPDSILARTVIKQATERGRPRCVSLVRQGGIPAPIYVRPAQATVFANRHLSPELIAELAHASSGVELRQLEPNELIPAEHELRRHSLQYLLWNCGHLGVTTDLLPWLPRMARFRLQRWPDFGRLGHKTWQVRLTSILMNNGYTLQQMTNIAAQPVANIRGFLNACSLCGLLTHEALPTAAAAETTHTPAPAKSTSRCSGILRSIRNALHIGDQ